ncbi:MAG: Uma2 family endonuclease [Bradymonadaceae bacterium]
MAVSPEIEGATRPRRRFTVEEYHRMAQAGVLGEDDRVELLDGEIVEMTPIGSAHASKVTRLTRMFVQQLDGRGVVWSQNPVRLDARNEPEPDLAILEPCEDDYADALPEPEDVLLIVEVAESSPEADREVKVPLYAQAGIPAVWIVNLDDEVVEVFEEPDEEAGAYGVERVASGEDRLGVEGLGGVEASVGEIFGAGS